MEKGKKKVETKTVKSVEKVQKKDNNQLKATIAGVAMIVAALGLSVGTYAYYQSTITGTVDGSITPWSFVVNDKATSFTAELGDLKPGVSGEITLNLSAEDSGLGVNAVVSFSGQTNWPANLKLYTDENHTSEIKVGTDTITRNLAAGTTDTVKIYYNWPLGDTAEEPQYGGQTASVNITVIGTQVEE